MRKFKTSIQIMVNATHIGKHLEGIGRFSSLYIAKHFIKKNKHQIILNSNAETHFKKFDITKTLENYGRILNENGFNS